MLWDPLHGWRPRLTRTLTTRSRRRYRGRTSEVPGRATGDPGKGPDEYRPAGVRAVGQAPRARRRTTECERRLLVSCQAGPPAPGVGAANPTIASRCAVSGPLTSLAAFSGSV